MTHKVNADIELETPSGHVWTLQAVGNVRAAEPDVGIFGRWVDEIGLYWLTSGKELSRSAYHRIPQCLWDKIEFELSEAIYD